MKFSLLSYLLFLLMNQQAETSINSQESFSDIVSETTKYNNRLEGSLIQSIYQNTIADTENKKKLNENREKIPIIINRVAADPQYDYPELVDYNFKGNETQAHPQPTGQHRKGCC